MGLTSQYRRGLQPRTFSDSRMEATMTFKSSARSLSAALFSILMIAGLCSGARAATSVSTCGTLSSPGSYVLSNNLNATGDCLVIAADNVAIDLHGNSIKGNGSGSGIKDDGGDRDYAVIANGKISNFTTGINLATSGSAIITNVNASNNSGTGILIGECCNTLNSVTANNNAGNGIEIDSDDSSFTKIQANNNGGNGILTTSCCNTLVSSTVSGNGGNGVDLADCCNFVIASKIQNNGGNGATLGDCCNGLIKTTAAHNGGAGMNLPDGDNMVTESKSSSNGGDGVDIGGKWGIIAGVQTKKNGGNGLSMDCRGSVASLKSQHNSSGNLSQTVVDGPCANVNVTAP
jgi:hypothetical protein